MLPDFSPCWERMDRHYSNLQIVQFGSIKRKGLLWVLHDNPVTEKSKRLVYKAILYK